MVGNAALPSSHHPLRFQREINVQGGRSEMFLLVFLSLLYFKTREAAPTLFPASNHTAAPSRQLPVLQPRCFVPLPLCAAARGWASGL